MSTLLLFSLLAGEALLFLQPTHDSFAGKTRFELGSVMPEDDLIGLELFINDESVFYWEAPPFETEIDLSRFPHGALTIRAELAVFGADKPVVVVLRGENHPYFEEQNVNLVRVPVQVSPGGQPFDPAGFSLEENGVTMSIAQLHGEQKPMQLVVLLDLSGSMDRFLPMLRRGVSTLLDSLREGDSVHLIGFSHRVFEISPASTDLDKARAGLLGLRVDGSTNFHGAVWSGLKAAGAKNQRRSLVVFTDGDHDLDGMEDLYGKDMQDCIDLAAETGIPIYSLGLGTGVRPEVLRELSERTGGRAFMVRNMKTVRQAFASIGSDLRDQYLLCYYSPSIRNGWHEIRVLHPTAALLRYPRKIYFRQ